MELHVANEEGRHKEVTPEEKSKGLLDLDIDPNFVNLKLTFSASTALKIIMEKVLGKEIVTLDDLPSLPRVEEHGWLPSYGGWVKVAREYIHAWSIDVRCYVLAWVYY